ncbi:hypothetical protein SZ64_10780 [Erythrobacter sp. SG61-1L]|nr:hypothetical protein SZ64_10780 [Erythrobacter sp. SG61-1L]
MASHREATADRTPAIHFLPVPRLAQISPDSQLHRRATLVVKNSDTTQLRYAIILQYYHAITDDYAQK